MTLIDPDGVIATKGLGAAVSSPAHIPNAIRSLLERPSAWKAASDRCRAFMDSEYGEDAVLARYVETFEEVIRLNAVDGRVLERSEHHV